jgi:hypothetical protein
VQERLKEVPAPEEFWLLWSYPPIQSGYDAFDFLKRRVVNGVELLGPGEVIPWSGSRFADGTMVLAPAGPLPEVPLWLARALGKPRSRKAMKAAREAYEAAMKASAGLSYGELLEAAREKAYARAQGEHEKASREAAEAEELEPEGEELGPVLEDEDEPEPNPRGVGWLP